MTHIPPLYPSQSRLLTPREVAAIDRQCITMRYPDDETPRSANIGKMLAAHLIGGRNATAHD